MTKKASVLLVAPLVITALALGTCWFALPSFRMVALRSLAFSGPDPARHWAIRKLRRADRSGAESLGLLIADPEADNFEREDILVHLHQLGHDAAPALPSLIRLLRRSEARGASPSIHFILQSLGPKADAALPALLDIAQVDGQSVPQHLALLASAKAVAPKDPRVIPIYVAAYQHPNGNVRYAAAEAMLSAPATSEQAIRFWIKTFGHPSVTVLREKAFKSIGAPAIPALMALLQHQDSAIRRRAARTLEGLDAYSPKPVR